MQCPFELILMKSVGFNGKDIRKREMLREAINGIKAERPGIFFSNSYSGEYGISGISDKPVGVDIEQHKRVISNAGVLDWLFPKDEENLKKLLFATLRWSLHEAIGKMNGVGLSENLSILNFCETGQADCQTQFWENGVCVDTCSMVFTQYAIVYRPEATGHLQETIAYGRDYNEFCICVVSSLA